MNQPNNIPHRPQTHSLSDKIFVTLASFVCPTPGGWLVHYIAHQTYVSYRVRPLADVVVYHESDVPSSSLAWSSSFCQL